MARKNNKEEVASETVGEGQAFDARNEVLSAKRAAYTEEMIENGEFSQDGLDEEANEHNEETVGVEEDTPPTVEKHKIRVNGKDLELSYDDLIARAQKVEAADEYLRKAKELSERVVPQPSSQDVEDNEEEDLELVRAIQMGNEEEATAAIRKLRHSATPAINKDELFSQFDERAKAQAASVKFASDFEDIFKDPVLRNLAFQEDTRLMAEGDTRPYEVRYTDIGNNIRSWRDSLTPNSQAASDKKVQRKIAAPQVPKAAGRMVQQVEQEEPEESRDEQITRMARARGQQF
jgi:hypothetical protein